MVTTIRLSDALRTRASAYAEGMGLSLNALIAVALAEYLNAQPAMPDHPATPRPVPPATPPAAPVKAAAPLSRQQRRLNERQQHKKS